MKTLQNVLKMSIVSPDTSREMATPLTDGCNNNTYIHTYIHTYRYSRTREVHDLANQSEVLCMHMIIPHYVGLER